MLGICAVLQRLVLVRSTHRWSPKMDALRRSCDRAQGWPSLRCSSRLGLLVIENRPAQLRWVPVFADDVPRAHCCRIPNNRYVPVCGVVCGALGTNERAPSSELLSTFRSRMVASRWARGKASIFANTETPGGGVVASHVISSSRFRA